MAHKTSRVVLAGVGAAAAAFGAAAIISAATAPTARADDFSGVTADVQAVQAAAEAAYSAASADFASGESGYAAGLTEYFTGIDDEVFGVPDTSEAGDLDVLYGVPVIPADTFEFSITTPTVADYVTEAQTVYTAGMAEMTTQANDFSMGDYTDGVVAQDLGWLDVGTLPGQIEFIGVVEQILALVPGY
jgi:hypothetical protein